jgi:hypothetical protein
MVGVVVQKEIIAVLVQSDEVRGRRGAGVADHVEKLAWVRTLPSVLSLNTPLVRVNTTILLPFPLDPPHFS